MNFYKKQIGENAQAGKRYAVYMHHNQDHYYVCEMVDSNAPEDAAANELGLTLRSRLVRSKGKYAMLQGTIFNPSRLINAACEITKYKKEDVSSGNTKGYTLLTVTADGCVNSYMVFDRCLLNLLIRSLDTLLVKGDTGQ